MGLSHSLDNVLTPAVRSGRLFTITEREESLNMQLTDDEVIFYLDCLRKTAMPTRTAAEAVARCTAPAGEQPINAYKCPYGAHYHVGRLGSGAWRTGGRNQIVKYARRQWERYGQHKMTAERVKHFHAAMKGV
jgi:hypothetical protein